MKQPEEQCFCLMDRFPEMFPEVACYRAFDINNHARDQLQVCDGGCPVPHRIIGL